MAEDPSIVDATSLPAVYGNHASVSALSEESLLHIMENYLQYYASGEGHTARAKRYDLNYFLEFLAGNKHQVHLLRVGDWTVQQTKSFVEARLQMGESPATVGRRLATVKHFGRTLAERVPGFINPAREVKGPVQRSARPHGLSDKEIAALRLAAADYEKQSFIGLRNHCLLELLLATGLRADEVRLLLMAQIAEDCAWLKNVKTKGQKFRNVYVHTHVRELLKNYIFEREEQLFRKFPILRTEKSLSQLPFFISLYNASPSVPGSFGLSPKTIWRIISGFGKKAQQFSDDPLGNLHPHRLRHTFAHGLLDSSKDIRLVAQALGHSDVRTTMRYTERTEDQIAEAIEQNVAPKERGSV